MNFGLFSLMAQRDRAVTARRLYEETVEQVKLAEAIGFDIAWFAEHHFSNTACVRRQSPWQPASHRRPHGSASAPPWSWHRCIIR